MLGLFLKHDPGPCIVCGCAHTACVPTTTSATVVIATPPRGGPQEPRGAETHGAPLSPTAVTTATYRRRGSFRTPTEERPT